MIDVPIYTSLSPESIKYILRHSNSVVCFVSNSLQLEKLISVVSELPDLKYIISYAEPKNEFSGISIRSLDSILKNTIKTTQKKAIDDLEILNKRISENDTLTIIYTSGTTGIPKGVMLTHKNVYTNIRSFFKILKIDDKEIFLSYLPYSHIFERSAGYYFPFFAASKIYYAQSIDTIALQMGEIRPTFVITVPRLLDKMYNKLMKSYEEMPAGFQKKVFKSAIDMAKERKIKKFSIKWKLADSFVYQKIREKTGGRIRYFASGGGALNKTIGEFFDYLGVETLEGYGMTETSPVICVNRPGKNKYGTVGPPVDGITVKIAEDGEILVKGDIVMKGYFNAPEETRNTIVNGWLHTGDIGEIDEDGYVKITDRKKSLFKSSGGKYIAPAQIEEMILQLPYVDQIIVIGNERMYVTALIIPDYIELTRQAKNLGLNTYNLSEFISNPVLLKKIENDINVIQKHLSPYEKVRKFTLLDKPFTIESGELTPTLKIKRKFVEEKYSALINKMYHKV
jgi:long-chain acyl-CoA synthetase